MTDTQKAITALLEAIEKDMQASIEPTPFWAVAAGVAERFGMDVDDLVREYKAEMERWANGDA